MNVCEIDSINVTGLVVRTKNVDEMDPAKAKIGALWQGFYANVLPMLTETSKVYGVYTNYESDATGSFDVIACADTLSVEMLENSVACEISSGEYLKFSAEGDLPQVVISLWGEILAYFSAENCEHTRAYTTDFEYYKGENEVEIYIAIQ